MAFERTGSVDYVELASPHVLHQRWKEVIVDVASTQSTLQDISLPECVGGFTYRDTHHVGSACYNRYIYWRTSGDLIELVELSSEFILSNNQVRIKFTNAPIINSIRIVETSDSLAILIATVSSVHRIILPHPKTQTATQLTSTKQFVINSILNKINDDLLKNNTTYYVLNGQLGNVPTTGASHPMSATSWIDDEPDLASFALTYPNGSIHIVKFNYSVDAVHPLETSMNASMSKHYTAVSSWELKQTSIIGRIWSRMPTLLAKNQNESDDAALSCVAVKFEEGNDIILFALCKDYKLRVWSTKYRELAHSYSLVAQPMNQSMSTSQSRITLVDLSSQQLLMRVAGKETKNMTLAIYMTEREPEFIIFKHKFILDKHSLEELFVVQAPEWDCLIDFAISTTKIWAVALNSDNEYMLYWLDLQSPDDPNTSTGSADCDEWQQVHLSEDLESLRSECRDREYQIIEEIFWRNKFSMSTILKGMSILGRGSLDIKLDQEKIQVVVDKAKSIIKNHAEETQHDSQNTDKSLAEQEAWVKFHTYCIQNHQVANKIIGLLVSDQDETVALIKRGNTSVVVPAPTKKLVQLQGPYAGFSFEGLSSKTKPTPLIMKSLIYLSQKVISDDLALTIEQKLIDDPVRIVQFLQDLSSSILESDQIDLSHILSFPEGHKMTAAALKLHYSLLFAEFKTISENLDLTEAASRSHSKRNQARAVSSHPYLTSNHGVACTFEMLKKMIRARFTLARDFALLLHLIVSVSLKESKKSKILNEQLSKLCEELYLSSTISKSIDCLRCYSVLLWISESPIKASQDDVKLAPLSTIQHLSEKFEYIKQFNSKANALVSPIRGQSQRSIDPSMQRNLLSDFLLNGGLRIAQQDIPKPKFTMSKCDIVTDVANSVCRLLWPKSHHQCFAEYLLCSLHKGHLFTYLELLDNWVLENEHDRNFLKAFNHLLSGEPSKAVTLFNRLWMGITKKNLLGRFLDLNFSANVMLNRPSQPDSRESGEKNDTNTAVLNSSQVSVGTIDDPMSISTAIIHKYYENLIQIFKLGDHAEDIINLINHCIPLLSEPSIEPINVGTCDNVATAKSQTSANTLTNQWINGLRTQLFKYHLDLDMTEEAYHAFVLNTDKLQCSNCLHQFIVYHCERERWQELLMFPYLELRDEFVQVLEQRASNSDLLRLAKEDFSKPSYYDILFSYWMMEYEYRRAASSMYKYAQRLGHEVPGIASVKKQADCLLIVLSCLRCLEDDRDTFVEVPNMNGLPDSDEQGHGNLLKRGYDCDLELPPSPSGSNVLSLSTQPTTTTSKYQPNIYGSEIDGSGVGPRRRTTIVDIQEIEMKYELTRARLILLKKDAKVNTIALSPLKVEETISYLVSSSMYTYAADLAILLKAPLEPVMKGLVEKFIQLFRMCPTISSYDQDIRQNLLDCLTNSYSCIEICNYLTNSNKSPVDKLWLLIDHYLETYDGVSHMCSDPAFVPTYSKSTVLLNIVATTLLSSGYDIPASLRRLYMLRNAPELLRLFIKYDQLSEAADLAVEMVDFIMEPANSLDFGPNPRPVYLPTHLILLLIEFLNEDATNKERRDIGYTLNAKLNKYRSRIIAYNRDQINTSFF